MAAGVTHDKHNATELKRWIQTEIRWKREDVSRLFPETKETGRPISVKNNKPELFIEPTVSRAGGWER